MSENTPESFFDLAADRTILLQDRGRQFLIICGSPKPADWFAYFDAISITTEQIGDKRISTLDFDTARVELAERVIKGAGGYSVSGGAELTSLPNWQSRIPLAHRRQIGAVLSGVRVSEELGDFVISPDGEEVSIDATFGAVDGKMVRLTGLKHIFNTPTAQQFKRYNQENSRSIVVGGSRTGRTIYNTPQRLLCELYDELIFAVEGYAWNVEPLKGPKVIRETMDLHHKFTAAQAIFNPESTVMEVTVSE